MREIRLPTASYTHTHHRRNVGHFIESENEDDERANESTGPRMKYKREKKNKADDARPTQARVCEAHRATQQTKRKRNRQREMKRNGARNEAEGEEEEAGEECVRISSKRNE